MAKPCPTDDDTRARRRVGTAVTRFLSSLARRRRVQVTVIAMAWIAALAVALPALAGRSGPRPPTEIALSQAVRDIGTHRVVRADLGESESTVVLRYRDGRVVTTRFPRAYTRSLTDDLLRAGVLTRTLRPDATGMPLWEALVRLAPPLLLGVLLVVLLRAQLGGTGQSGRQSRLLEVPGTSFADVAGCAEAVADLAEIAVMIRDPGRFRETGARMPRGYLLVGPPGTGKTLLARAVAGEAGVPFFSTSGADFTDMFVGVGRRRIRTLFSQARRAAAETGGAVVFLDEIDAVGGTRARERRDAASDDRDATLVALLTEMDGFGAPASRRHGWPPSRWVRRGHRSSRQGDPGTHRAATDGLVMVLAATNRSESLDPALTRPGRFDRQITVAPPDAAGRAAVLRVHAARVSLAGDVDLDALGRRTPGLVGADLENLVNEAAMEAGRRDRRTVDASCFEEALATIAMGRARTSALVSERDRRITAWHEAGHAVTAMALAHADDPVSVTIVPRGTAGGSTWMGGNDHAFLTREQALARLAVSLGGRAGEELALDGSYSQGAASDLEAATELALAMATEYGMTRLGLARRPRTNHAIPSDVLDVVNELLDDALATARACLTGHGNLFEAVVDGLLERETLAQTDLSGLRDRFAPSSAPAQGVPLPGAGRLLPSGTVPAPSGVGVPLPSRRLASPASPSGS